MIILSEITGKEYDTVDECIADENLFMEKIEAEKKAREEHEKAIHKAYKEAIAACEKYFELVGVDIECKCNEHGCKCKASTNDTDILFEQFFNSLFE